MDLDGKRALITGGAGGVGFEIARALLGAGARVGVTARGADAVERAARDHVAL